MLSYQTPATIKAANAKAEEITGHKLAGHDPIQGSRSESLALAHKEALARRNAG